MHWAADAACEPLHSPDRKGDYECIRIYVPYWKNRRFTRKLRFPFGDDEHISGEMLKAHLDPDFEGASRKLPFIEKSVRWIGELAPAGDYRRMIDFGCGPGLYGERLARTGYEVTGVDMSRRSIAYAERSAREKGLDIRYLQKNYLQMDLGETFDFATMIYCDYGALSTVDRRF